MKLVTFDTLEKIKNQMDELYGYKAYTAIAVSSRRLLEGILIYISQLSGNEGIEKNERPKSILVLLKELEFTFSESIIFSEVLSNMHFLREEGNKAVHIWDESYFDEKLTLSVLKSTNYIWEWFVSNFKQNTFEKTFYDNTEVDYVVTIQLKNFETIENISLDSKYHQFIVLVGDNGIGKTLLLQLIASTLAGEKFKWKKSDKNDFEINIGIVNLGHIWAFSSNNEDSNNQETNAYNNIVAYGASRLELQSAESMADAKLRASSIHNLFRSDSPLLNIEFWLASKLRGGHAKLVNEVLDILAKHLPNIGKVTYEEVNGEYFFKYISIYGEEAIEFLSAGHKGVISFLGDMLIRLLESQPKAKSLSELKGIVVIDEIEAHLHPNWQKKLPKLLSETFPKVQFIISTHTPMTILGIPSDSVLLHVGRPNNEEKSKVERLELDIENMSPQQLLTSPLFGLESVRSLYSEELEDFHTEETYAEILKRKEVQDRIKKLSENFTFKEPEE